MGGRSLKNKSIFNCQGASRVRNVSAACRLWRRFSYALLITKRYKPFSWPASPRSPNLYDPLLNLLLKYLGKTRGTLMQSVLYPGSRKQCASFWPGCRLAWGLVRCRGLYPRGSTEALGSLIPGRKGLGARGSCLNGLDQDISLARHVRKDLRSP